VLAGDCGQQDVESKYKSCAILIRALGTITKGLYQNLQLLPVDRSAIELQKVTLMSTAHSIGKGWGKSL
jgi:hypothetical protein